LKGLGEELMPVVRAVLNYRAGMTLDENAYKQHFRLYFEYGCRRLKQIWEECSNDLRLFISSLLKLSNLDGVTDTEKSDKTSGYEKILTIRIGIEKDSLKPHMINFNKTDEHANNYVGIIGRPGSGKTFFLKDFLRKLREESSFQMNFIVFDYAKGDIADDKEFIRNTRAEIIDVSQQPIPINIFKITNPSDSENRFQAERIVRIIRDVEGNIGKVQEQNLYTAILRAYGNIANESNPYPDFNLIRSELELINSKPDSLTSVFRPLTEHNLFATREMPTWDSLINRTVIFDIHKLPTSKDLCVFFILNEIYKQLMAMPDSEVEPIHKVREMKTVIVIDEAHHFLKNKKRVGILENLIREIRSKGASVFLLSQSPDDYDQAEFNFLELLEFVYVLGCSPSSSKFLKQVFGITNTEAQQIIRDVVSLGQGEAFGKGKDKKTVRLKLCA